jgi:hypothetical protein
MQVVRDVQRVARGAWTATPWGALRDAGGSPRAHSREDPFQASLDLGPLPLVAPNALEKVSVRPFDARQARSERLALTANLEDL